MILKMFLLQKDTLSLLLFIITFTSLRAQSEATVAPMLMELVTVDALNNSPDTRTGLGSVAYEYQIGKFDVTVRQYAAFLNAVASRSDPHELYHSAMKEDYYVNAIARIVDQIGCHYETTPGKEDCPITIVSWFDAARFCNWMENGCPSGPEDASTTENGSYLVQNGWFTLNRKAHWRLPTENEWYKAAYYNRKDPTHYWTYSTQSDEAPGNSCREEDNQNDSPQKNANYFTNGRCAQYIEGTKNNRWFRDSSNVYATPDGIPSLTPAGLFQASPGPFGSYDMGGNARQWTTGIKQRNERLQYLPLRGGSRYRATPQGISYQATDSLPPRYKSCDLGFRLVCQTPDQEPMQEPDDFCLQESEQRTWLEWWDSWFREKI